MCSCCTSRRSCSSSAWAGGDCGTSESSASRSPLPNSISSMSDYFTTKRVLVTGGAGFLGSFVVEQLRTRGCKLVFVPRSREYDLVEMEAVRRLLDDAKPDLVIHLAPR